MRDYMRDYKNARALVLGVLDQKIFQARVLRDRLSHSHDATRYPRLTPLPERWVGCRTPQPTRAQWDQHERARLKAEMTVLHALLSAGNGNVHPVFHTIKASDSKRWEWQLAWLGTHIPRLDHDHSWWSIDVRALGNGRMASYRFSTVLQLFTEIRDPVAREAAIRLGGSDARYR